MKKSCVDFICNLHGYLIRVKEIHWNTNNNAEHLLCDEIESCLHDCEDRFAECVMGLEGKHFKVGDLKPMLPNATTLGAMLKELQGDVKSMRSKTNENSIINILDDIEENCAKFTYRSTQS